jgi:homoserine kinase type II
MSGAQFWRITTQRGVLALRRWPTEHPTPQRLQFIHSVLQHAARSTITFIPVPIRTTVGESFIRHSGHLWELAPWMPGIADYERSPSAHRLRAALQTLAQFHAAVANFNLAGLAASQRLAGSTPAITKRLARLHDLSHGGHQQLVRAINAGVWPDLVPVARQFLAALPDILPRAVAQLEPLLTVTLPQQACLRDIWHDHVLFTGNQVTGIIDFGALDIDTPATDIARLLGSLAGDDRTGWQIGLDAYCEIRPLSPDERSAVHALDKSGTLLAGCNWIRWIYVEGREFENRPQIIDRFRRIVNRVLNQATIQ